MEAVRSSALWAMSRRLQAGSSPVSPGKAVAVFCQSNLQVTSSKEEGVICDGKPQLPVASAKNSRQRK